MPVQEKTIDDFTIGCFAAEPIEESGQRTYGSGIPMSNINYSSSLTRLIQEAGRWCKHYASDLFLDWMNLVEKLENGTLESGSYLFGFREYGVDHTQYILNRYNTDRYAGKEYRSIWRLDIEVTDDYVKFATYEVGR